MGAPDRCFNTFYSQQGVHRLKIMLSYRAFYRLHVYQHQQPIKLNTRKDLQYNNGELREFAITIVMLTITLSGLGTRRAI